MVYFINKSGPGTVLVQAVMHSMSGFPARQDIRALFRPQVTHLIRVS